MHHLQSGTDPSLLCITAARISGLPQAVQVQIEDNALPLGKLACRACYHLGEQIVQKIRSPCDSLAVSSRTGIALDVTVNTLETSSHMRNNRIGALVKITPRGGKRSEAMP